MKGTKEKVIQWYAVLAVVCLGLVMLSLPVRFVTLHAALKHQAADVNEINVKIDWQQQYPFAQADADEQETSRQISRKERYDSLVRKLEEKIEYYCTEGLFFYGQAVAAAAESEQIVGCDAENFAGDVIRMNNGYLTYQEEKLEEAQIQELADEVADLKQFLDAQGIEFLYGNAGSKVCPYDKQLSDETLEYTNENGTALVEALRENGISVIDFRDEMQCDGLDWYDSYYKADHHWKTQMGLWAADKLAGALNETGRFSFDRAIFEKENYTFETYENCFFGGQAKSVTFASANLESYTKILPKFPTAFQIQIPTRSVDLQGTYAETLFDSAQFEKILSYTKAQHLSERNCYDCARGRNDALVQIQNLNSPDNADKKILMLQDSFSWYTTSFLACGIGQIDAIHLAAFSGSLRSYIKQTKPDAVVMVYCERNIKPLERAGHEHLFDLR